MANREGGEGLVTRGIGGGGGLVGEGHSETRGGARKTMGEGGHIRALDVGRAGVVGDGIGGTGS